MAALRYNHELTGLRYLAGALPLADSLATAGEGDGPGRSRRTGPP
jgi:hypothetical protein